MTILVYVIGNVAKATMIVSVTLANRGFVPSFLG